MNNQGGSNSRANIHENYFNEYFNGNFITTCPVKGNVNKCKGKWRTTITIYTLPEANDLNQLTKTIYSNTAEEGVASAKAFIKEHSTTTIIATSSSNNEDYNNNNNNSTTTTTTTTVPASGNIYMNNSRADTIGITQKRIKENKRKALIRLKATRKRKICVDSLGNTWIDDANKNGNSIPTSLNMMSDPHRKIQKNANNDGYNSKGSEYNIIFPNKFGIWTNKLTPEQMQRIDGKKKEAMVKLNAKNNREGAISTSSTTTSSESINDDKTISKDVCVQTDRTNIILSSPIRVSVNGNGKSMRSKTSTTTSIEANNSKRNQLTYYYSNISNSSNNKIGDIISPMDTRLRRYQDSKTDTSLDEIAKNGSSNHGNNTTLRTTIDFGIALIKSEVQLENILNHHESNDGSSATGKTKRATQGKKRKQQTKIEV